MFKVYEDKLPDKDSLPLLLRTIFDQTVGYSVDFQFVKPIKEKEDKESVYDKLRIEMKFLARYHDVIQYLRRLEGALPFIKITQINIQQFEDEKNPHNDLREVILVLQTLFSPYKRSQGIFIEEASRIPKLSLSGERDPFVSLLRIEDQPQEEKIYTLNGVVWNGAKSTAIIDDEVYRIGDKIGDGIVNEIKNDEVILSFGNEIIHLIVNN